MRVVDLRTSALSNPLGIAETQPQLRWRVEDAEPGFTWTKAVVRVYRKSDLIWTGEVESAAYYLPPTDIQYAGPPLASRERIEWEVEIEGVVSERAWFEAGLLSASDWTAKWIMPPWFGGARTTSPPAHFRRSFPASNVLHARLYVSAAGAVHPTINGQPISQDRLAPGWTDLKHWVFSRTYDILGFLQDGENEIEFLLGDGWAAGHVAHFGRQRWVDRPRLIAQLELICVDGTTQTIATDETWDCGTGHIREADLLMGEAWDLRIEPTFDQKALLAPDDLGPLTPWPGPSIQPVAVLPARDLKVRSAYPTPKLVYDFGQNLTGFVRLRVKGQRGETLGIRFAEVLNPDGSLYTDNYRAARCQDWVTLSGDDDLFDPLFTFRGFRFCEVTGWTGDPFAISIEAVVLQTQMEATGDFTCSEPALEQLWRNAQWSIRGNMLDVPTDCPTRDERLGWTGDALMMADASMDLFDCQRVWARWLKELAFAVDDQGRVPMAAPLPGPGMEDGGPAWSDALISVAQDYLCFDDQTLLKEIRPALVRFLEAELAQAKDGIRCHPDSNRHCFGDWLCPGQDTPHDLIGTAFLHRSLLQMAYIDSGLGIEDRDWRTEAKKVRHAFFKRFITPAGQMVCGTQTAMMCALMLAERDKPNARLDQIGRNFIRSLEAAEGRIQTGFVGTPLLYSTLRQLERVDRLGPILTQTQAPSFLHSVMHGATTLWERWDGWTAEKGFQDPAMNSFNHAAMADVASWMMRYLSGIWTPYDFSIIGIQPRLIPGIEHARAILPHKLGPVESGWELVDGVFHLFVSLPPGARGVLQLPPGEVTEAPESAKKVIDLWHVQSGSWDFAVRLD